MKKQPLVLIESNTITIVTGAGAYIIDKKTGKVIEFIPEKPVLETVADIFEAATSLFSYDVKSKQVEELQLQTAKLLVSLTEMVATEVTAKAISGE